MESMYILVPISIVLAFIIAYFFWWSGKNGQFDDLEGPAYRILMDDDSTEQLNPDNQMDQADTAEKESKHESKR